MKKRLGIVIIAALLCIGVAGFAVNYFAGEKYESQEAWHYEGTETFSIYAKEAGTIKVKSSKSLGSGARLLVNGRDLGEYTSGYEHVDLNKGVNSIAFKTEDEESPAVDLLVKGGEKFVDAGSPLAYDRYEAEEEESDGKIEGPDREYHSIASEASGRSYVLLDKKGQSLSFTLKNPADALVIRYSIPDSPDGKGVDDKMKVVAGDKEYSLDITSKYAWVYGNFPWNNDPATASVEAAHVFFDEARIKFDEPYPAGTEISLVFPEDAISDSLIIDLVEAEETPEEIPMSENALSITDFGAVANDEGDDADAIAECIKAAASEKKEVYIPAGNFLIKDKQYIRGITISYPDTIIRGAGMWHTNLYGDAAGFLVMAQNVGLYDFSLTGTVSQRFDSIDPPAINLTDNTKRRSNITMQNLWIEHFKLGTWANTTMGVRIAGCRIRNTLADGINLCGGSSHSMIEYNDLRNTGDDAIACWSKGVVDEDNKIRHNTVALPWLANHIALYGGKDIIVENNYLTDSIHNGGGINVSTNFNPQDFEGEVLIQGNVMDRCGSMNTDAGGINGGIWINSVDGKEISAHVIIKDNVIKNSTYSGISFIHGGPVSNMVIEKNEISGSATAAIEVLGECTGEISLGDNTFKDNAKDEIDNKAGDDFKIIK
ncbi:MAG: right-handed parallel beta-helix repeat-containing protein [Pseudobutyrivibrio sp.]|nr:right-handed parallel beta-helix repeat-containing protein [Pseudobutyrivibrio sp.]